MSWEIGSAIIVATIPFFLLLLANGIETDYLKTLLILVSVWITDAGLYYALALAQNAGAAEVITGPLSVLYQSIIFISIVFSGLLLIKYIWGGLLWLKDVIT